jgi:hypothetical protein
MALTQAFKQTVRARVQRDGRYRELGQRLAEEDPG